MSRGEGGYLESKTPAGYLAWLEPGRSAELPYTLEARGSTKDPWRIVRECEFFQVAWDHYCKLRGRRFSCQLWYGCNLIAWGGRASTLGGR